MTDCFFLSYSHSCFFNYISSLFLLSFSFHLCNWNVFIEGVMLSHENIMAATCASILQVKHFFLLHCSSLNHPFPMDLLTNWHHLSDRYPIVCFRSSGSRSMSWKRIFHPYKPRRYGDAVPYCSMRDGTDMGNVSQDVRKSVREVVGWRDAFASKNYFITDWSCSWESMRLGGRTSSSPFCPWPTPSRSAASSPPSSGP